jgi:hypothetical protein
VIDARDVTRLRRCGGIGGAGGRRGEQQRDGAEETQAT